MQQVDRLIFGRWVIPVASEKEEILEHQAIVIVQGQKKNKGVSVN